MANIPGELIRNREITVALAGNPNSGKTSIFNRLTGGHQHVGNYPGVTVEKKWGKLRGAAGPMKLVDLPGTYSLNALSDEERVARRFLLDEKPDVVLDVLDSSNLERNLHLAVQLMELEVNLALVLNMADMAQETGQVLDLKRLAELTGAPVVETVGHKGGGLDDLRLALREAAATQSGARQVDYGDDLEVEIATLTDIMTGLTGLRFPARYAAIKLLEGDIEVTRAVEALHPDRLEIQAHLSRVIEQLTRKYKDAPSVLIADRRYGFAAGLAREVTRRAPRTDRITESEKVDAVLTHRFLGLPIFLLFMYGLFWLTFTVGTPLMDGIDALFGLLATGVDAGWPEGRLDWLHSLISDGIIGGVGGVLVFLPNIVLLFLGISILEDTGYMSRAAFIMDRVMHRFGLHGKSFIPMLIGFGCTVPAIMATRALPSKRDRIVTMLILPFISCGARLPIYLLLIPAFFPRGWHTPVLFGLYMLGILMGLVVARILSNSMLAGDATPFVMELPPYRRPTGRSVGIHMWQRSWMYLRKAGTIILVISILLWGLMSFPKPIEYAVDRQVAAGTLSLSEEELAAVRAGEVLEYSLAGRIGRAIQPVMAPLGFDWRINTAFLGAFAAKEVFVAQLGIIFSLGEVEDGSSGLREVLARHYTPLQGLSILIFALLATPCMATFAITRRESGRWGYALLQWFGLTGLAYLLSLIIYQVGGLLGA
jgi:ferrous iron transport protein B